MFDALFDNRTSFPAMDPDWSRDADSFYDFIHAARAVARRWEAAGLVGTTAPLCASNLVKAPANSLAQISRISPMVPQYERTPENGTPWYRNLEPTQNGTPRYPMVPHYERTPQNGTPWYPTAPQIEPTQNGTPQYPMVPQFEPTPENGTQWYPRIPQFGPTPHRTRNTDSAALAISSDESTHYTPAEYDLANPANWHADYLPKHAVASVVDSLGGKRWGRQVKSHKIWGSRFSTETK